MLRLPVFLSRDNDADHFSGAVSFQDMCASGNGFSGGCHIIDDPNALVSNIKNLALDARGVQSESVFNILLPVDFVANGHLRGGVSCPNEERVDECGSDIFREMAGECLREDIGLIPASPSFAPRVKRDGDEGVGKGKIGGEYRLCEEGSERLSEVVNKSVFVEMNEAGESRVGIMERRKKTVMCD